VFIQGLAYPDTPSSEQYQPNSIEATNRFNTFNDLLVNTPDLDLDAEIEKLESDLEAIYNK
jgi:multiple sugar transport system substrate-binding protein